MNFLVGTRQRLAFFSSPWLLNLLRVLLLTACTSVQPRVRPALDYAAAPHSEGPFVALEKELQAEYGADASGFKLLERNEEGLRWRLALIDSAQHSLDLLYYVWFGDT